MAALNTATTEQTAPAKKAPTHFMNVSVLTSAGKPIKLGAVAIFEDGADKAQRTLIAQFKAGVDLSKLDIMIDVRENVKSTDVYDADEWSMIERTYVEEPAK